MSKKNTGHRPAKRPAEGFKRWDQYTAEAKHAPFRLQVSEDEILVIEVPTGGALLQAARAMRTGDIEALLEMLAGDAWPRLEEITSGAPFPALLKLCSDLTEFFGMAQAVEYVGPGGGHRLVSNPVEAQQLVLQGWHPVGEAPSRP